MLIDLHSHSTLSDGTPSIEGMVAAAERRGYAAYALTDHAHGSDPGYGDLATAVRDEVERLVPHTGMHLFAGVELTDFPPPLIPQAARRGPGGGGARRVPDAPRPARDERRGRALPDADILAHPGLLSPEDAQAAAAHDIYLEVSARHGHDYAN
ncbi:MAG: PHP domain-containing protein, partial [Chloroflexi bacterium]|nr:PHP domain-containing protein [Chloroflexota bacterium]